MLEVCTMHVLSGPVLCDTAILSQRYPPIASCGAFSVSTWPIGCDTPSPFSEHFPLGVHAKKRCDTPPFQKGYLSNTSTIPYENKAKRVRYPPLRYYRERVLRDMGGESRTGPLSACAHLASVALFCWAPRPINAPSPTS